MKFRKVKNKEKWVAKNGTTITWDYFAKQYCINRRTFFKFVNGALEDAIKIAENNFRFNKEV